VERGTPSLQLPQAADVVELERPASPGVDHTLDPAAKKARNLNKKVSIFFAALLSLF
jgi:hypothetical protein